MTRKTIVSTVSGLLITLVTVFTLSGCNTPELSGASLETNDPPGRIAGTLFIVGGGPQPDYLVKEFADLAGGRNANIVVFSMAGTAASGESKATSLRRFAGTVEAMDITRSQANTAAVLERLDKVTAIWFIGGSQTQLANVLRGTQVEAKIKELYRNGALIGGTSAGAAVMSTPMITGGQKKPGGSRPSGVESTEYITIDRDNIRYATGFTLLPNAIIDQHFLRRRRNNRLISLVLENPGKIGVGIDESTAIIVHPEGHWSVTGESVALIYDARAGSVTRRVDRALGATGINFHILPAGATFDPRNGQARLPDE